MKSEENVNMRNKTNNNIKFLVTEFIEAVLKEEGDNALYNTFIQPFVDVGTTTAYGIEKLSSQVQTVFQGFLYGLPTLIMPFLEFDYEKFREEEKETIEAIKKKYEKTLQTNFEAITSNDAFGVAFLLSPYNVLAAQLAVKAPERALQVLDILTGGSDILAGLRKSLAGVASIGFHDPGHHPAGAWSGGGGGYGGDFDGGMYEAAGAPREASRQMQQALKDKKLYQAVQKSPIATQMRRDGVKVVVDHIKKFMSITDYDQLRKMAQGDVGFNQIGQKLGQLNQSGQIPAKDNAVVTAALVPQVKKAYKDFWISHLQKLSDQYPEARAELAAGIREVQTLS